MQQGELAGETGCCLPGGATRDHAGAPHLRSPCSMGTSFDSGITAAGRGGGRLVRSMWITSGCCCCCWSSSASMRASATAALISGWGGGGTAVVSTSGPAAPFPPAGAAASVLPRSMSAMPSARVDLLLPPGDGPSAPCAALGCAVADAAGLGALSPCSWRETASCSWWGLGLGMGLACVWASAAAAAAAADKPRLPAAAGRAAVSSRCRALSSPCSCATRARSWCCCCRSSCSLLKRSRSCASDWCACAKGRRDKKGGGAHR